jgi:hypothetical protein
MRMTKLPEMICATIIFILFCFFITEAKAEDKFLSYQFNQNVIIRISNVPCKVPKMDVKKYPHAAVAMRIDRQYMFGCFTHKGDDIVIQWAGEGSDQTILPANAFLMDN